VASRRWIRPVVFTLVALAICAAALRACYRFVVNEDDQPAADRIVAALDGYRAAHGRYPPTLQALVPAQLPALPTPREFGRIGYASLDDGRDCLLGYFTHRDFLKEYACGARTWEPREVSESRLLKAPAVDWLQGPRP